MKQNPVSCHSVLLLVEFVFHSIKFVNHLFIIPVKQSPVMEQKLAEEVRCTENVSYDRVTSASTRPDREVDRHQEVYEYVQV